MAQHSKDIGGPWTYKIRSHPSIARIGGCERNSTAAREGRHFGALLSSKFHVRFNLRIANHDKLREFRFKPKFSRLSGEGSREIRTVRNKSQNLALFFGESVSKQELKVSNFVST